MQKNRVKTYFLLSSIFIVGIAFYCYEFFLRLLTGAYEPQIVDYFKLNSHISFSFLISSYNLTYLLMQIPAGLLLDKFGSKKVLVIATLLCGIGNIIFVSHYYIFALFGRLIVGLGSSFAFVGVLKLSRDYLPRKYFGLFASIVISLGTLAAAFSQQLSIMLLSYHWSWVNIFIFSGILALPLAVIFWFILNNKITYVNQVMPNLKNTVGIAMTILRDKPIWLNALWAGLLYIPTVVLTAQYGELYFRSIYHISSYSAVKLITILLLGWVVFSPVMNFLASKIEKITPIVLINGFLLLITIYVLSFMPEIAYPRLKLLVFLFGVFSSCQVLVWHVFNKICPQNLSGIGIAVTNMIITGITEIGQLLSGLVLDWHAGLKLFTELTGYIKIMQFDTLIFIIAIVSSIILFYPFYKKTIKI